MTTLTTAPILAPAFGRANVPDPSDSPGGTWLGGVFYPESDGLPVAENTSQFRWITTIQGGVDDLFRNEPNVFVAGDLLWYPVENSPQISVAPDAMVVFGRPKGDRLSYIQWQENGIAPQVVFEVWSPSNDAAEKTRKHALYERHGVEEFYAYDPGGESMSGAMRASDGRLRPIEPLHGHVSPRLGIRFDLSGPAPVLYRPDGHPILTYVELGAARDQAEQQRQQAEQRAERLAAHLRKLGVDPDAL
jgi:Uma2 family endonuclease